MSIWQPWGTERFQLLSKCSADTFVVFLGGGGGGGGVWTSNMHLLSCLDHAP